MSAMMADNNSMNMQNFEALGLSEDILKGVFEAGFTVPTPIQAETIPHILAGRDVLAQEISGIREQMAEVRKNREDCKEGWLSATAREEAKKMVLTQHPEVVEACEQHMARHWEETNAARLEQRKERPAGRESGNEQSRDNGERKSL